LRSGAAPIAERRDDATLSYRHEPRRDRNGGCRNGRSDEREARSASEPRRPSLGARANQEDGPRRPRASPEERRSVIDPIVTFLGERFLPRAEAEEAAIYPKLTLAFSRDVTVLLLFHHHLIERQAAELAAADPRDGARLQELLYGLHALIESHLAREREAYLRLLFGGGAATSAPLEEEAAAA